MAILTVGGEPYDFIYDRTLGLSSGFLSISTTSARFDSDFSRGAVTANVDTYAYLDLGANYSDFWFHGELYMAAGSNSSTIPVVGLYNSSGVLQYGIFRTANNTMRLRRLVSSSLTDIGTTWTHSAANRVRYDVHFNLHASTGSLEVYTNDSLAYSTSGADTGADDNNIRYIVFWGNGSTESFSFSQLILASESTLGWRLNTLPAVAVGDEVSWTGDYTAIDGVISGNFSQPVTPNEFISSNSIDAIETHNITNLPGAAAAYDVKAIVIKTRGFITDDSVPTDYQHVIRHSSTNYLSADLGAVPGSGVFVHQTIYEDNPGTASAWTPTDVNNLQVGVKAVT